MNNVNSPTNLSTIKNNVFVNHTVAPQPYPTTSNHFEKQELYLCAKHAINHVLQEDKIVFYPTGSNGYKLYFNGTDPMDRNTQINIHNYCRYRLNKIYRRTMNRKVSRMFTNDDCDDAIGNYQVNVLSGIFTELLKYKVNIYGPTQANFSEILADLDDNNTLGAVINVPGHWIAISRFFNRCHKGTGQTKVYRWSLLDSLDFPKYKCSNTPKPLLKPLLDSGDMLQILVVKDNRDAYQSEAVSRRSFMYNARFPGGTRKTRRHRRSTTRRSN